MAFGDSETEIITFSAEGGLLKHVKWDWAKSRASWETDLGPAPGMPTAIPTVCESRDLLATDWSDGSVIVASWMDGTKVGVWKAHKDPVGVVAFSRDGSLVLTADRINFGASVEGVVIVWSCSDLETIEPCYEIDGHRSWLHSAAFSPDGKILATGGSDSRILLWDAATGDFRQELVGQKELVCVLIFAPDGKTLVSAHGDGTVRFWHVATGRELAKIRLEHAIRSAALSCDGNTLAATSGLDPWAPDELHIWRVPSYEEIESIEEVSTLEQIN